MNTVQASPPVRPHLVDYAVMVVTAFGGPYITRPQAEALLRTWGHRYALTGAEWDTVIDRFPADGSEMPDGVAGYPIGGQR